MDKKEVEREKTAERTDSEMTVEVYDMEVREVHHDLGYWIINQSYYYSDTKYTKEQAIEKFMKEKGITAK